MSICGKDDTYIVLKSASSVNIYIFQTLRVKSEDQINIVNK